MTVLQAVAAFAVVAGALTLVPGLDTALVVRSTLTRSRAYAWATAWGIASGAMTWGIAAAVGVSALLTASESAYRALTLAGAVYMVWLGVTMIRRSLRARDEARGLVVGGPVDPEAVRGGDAAREPADSLHLIGDDPHDMPRDGAGATREGAAHDPAWRGWLTGMVTNLLNPKVGVFYVAMIPQFMPAGVSPLLMGALLAGVHAVLTMAWFSVLVLGGRVVRRFVEGPRANAVIDRVTGGLLVVFGVTLVWELVSASLPGTFAVPAHREPGLVT